MLSLYATIFFGGGLGATLRFFLSSIINNQFKKIWVGTLLVNLLGCLVLYLSVKFFSQNQLNSQLIRIGFCGSLTTFSTFSFEILTLFQTGHYLQAGLILLLNIVLGVGMGYFIL